MFSHSSPPVFCWNIDSIACIFFYNHEYVDPILLGWEKRAFSAFLHIVTSDNQRIKIPANDVWRSRILFNRTVFICLSLAGNPRILCE